MAGEYRLPEVLAKLPAAIADPIRNGNLRIALANQPMAGVVARPELSADMAIAYEAAGERKYANGLRSGSMVPITVPSRTQKYWAPGELFLRS